MEWNIKQIIVLIVILFLQIIYTEKDIVRNVRATTDLIISSFRDLSISKRGN